VTALLWLALIALAAHGYGRAIAAAVSLDLRSRLEWATLTVGLGTAVLVTVTFVLGLAHAIGRFSSLFLVLPAAGWAIWKIVGSPREANPTAAPRWLRVALLTALGVCVGANVVATLAPPSFVDALFYHLFIARAYARTGGIVELPVIWESYQPLGVEMLFTLGFTLQGEVLAALTHTALGVLAAAGTCLLGRRIAGPIAGLLSAAMFYCTAMIAWESTSCFVELGITAFSTLGFYSLLRWTDDESPRWLVVAALLLASAGVCKLTALQFPLIAAGLVGWISWHRRRGLGPTSGRVGIFVGIALAFGLPWYLHAYLWTGNPVYPFATRLFGDNPDYKDVWFILSNYGPGHDLKNLLLAPWLLFSSGALFECGQYLSPIPFIFSPLILFRLKGSRDRQVLSAAVGASLALWLASAHIARYLIPLQPLLAVLAADAICWVAPGSRYRQRLLVLSGALFIGFGTVSTLLVMRTMVPVVLGRESVEAYLSRTAAFYTTYKMVMADVPANGLILTNQGPTFYLDRPHVRVRDAEFFAGPERLAKLIAGGSFTHILVHGQVGIEPAVVALGPRVKLLWHRDLDMPLSRSFGDTVKLPSALYEIVR
jgi:4-amino-4-deoxy-L-arabinose transferase-like glycosyltransferase